MPGDARIFVSPPRPNHADQHHATGRRTGGRRVEDFTHYMIGNGSVESAVSTPASLASGFGR